MHGHPTVPHGHSPVPASQELTAVDPAVLAVSVLIVPSALVLAAVVPMADVSPPALETPLLPEPAHWHAPPIHSSPTTHPEWCCNSMSLS